MNFKKRLLVFCLIICVLFSISSIYASDIDDAVIASDISDEAIAIEDTNDELIAPSDEEETVGTGTGTFSDLQEIINNTPSGSTISLDKDYAYDSGFNISGIKIQKDLTINGNGHTLDGLSKTRIFAVTYNDKLIEEYYTVTLNNINFKNGNADDYGEEIYGGGAIFMECTYELDLQSFSPINKHCHFIINNCVFSNNYAQRYGGAIFNPESFYCTNKLTISDST